MNSEILKRAQEWTSDFFNSSTRDEVQNIINSGNTELLTDMFYKNLEFGTGGLRGKIGAGTNRMNIYTVGLATQGLAAYIRESDGSSRGVVISYDSRNMSDIFARTSASVLAANGITVYLFDELTPTPLCSFAVRHLKAAAGIMITASHNPPAYNGYKVFWDDGCQIVPPQDSEIIRKIREIKSVSDIISGDFQSFCEEGLIITIGDDIREAYLDQLLKASCSHTKESSLSIVYSPLHGTGYKLIPEALRRSGFSQITIVPEQAEPDGNFPTVVYPNPEEEDAMKLCLSYGRKHNADICIATDPDADRIGVGIRNSNSEYMLLNGNQTAVLLADYILHRKSEAGELEKGVIVKTIITTDMLKVLAESYKVACENVLTGFKWIGMKMAEYDTNHQLNYIFGCEESYGYLPVTFVRDKDAVSSACFICEMAHYYKERSISLHERLMQLYRTYGMYMEDMHYLVLEGLEGAERIQRIMEGFRKNPPHTVADVQIKKLRDYQNLTELDINTGAIKSIMNIPSSNVLQFEGEDGSSFTIRPSGTEPKIKFYISVTEKLGNDNLVETERDLKERISRIKAHINTRIEMYH